MNNESRSKNFARRKIDFARIDNLILVLLYQRYMDGGRLFIQFNEITSAIPGEPRNAIWDELNSLKGAQKVTQETERRFKGFLGALGSTGTNDTYDVTVDGYKIARKGIEEVNSFSDEAYEILMTEIKIVQPTEKKIESDKWEPLPLDRQSTEFTKAVEATDIALKEIEGSNGYAGTSPDERNSVVETIKSNLKNLKEGLISKGQIIEGLIKPLTFVASKFAEASIGELAKRAANFLWHLITGI
jgi:hypothetical protein